MAQRSDLKSVALSRAGRVVSGVAAGVAVAGKKGAPCEIVGKAGG